MPSQHMTFARALCMHFRLPMDQVLPGLSVDTREGSIFAVQLSIALSAEDMTGIANYMTAGRRRDDNQAPLPPLDLL